MFEDDAGTPHHVIARHRNVSMCLDYFHKTCDAFDCRKFHVCRNCLAGYCKDGDDCTKSVDFSSEHNSRIIQGLNLHKLTEDDKKNLLFGSTLQVCLAYNNPGGCPDDDTCIRVHLCRNFVQNQCYKPQECTLSHTVDSEHSQRLLTLYSLQDKRKNYIILFNNQLSI